MPHLNVTVDGKKYSISGLTRKTCSKQILCALAKINEDVGVIKATRTPQRSNVSSDELVSSDSGADNRIQHEAADEKSKKRRSWSKSGRKVLGGSRREATNSSMLRRESFGRKGMEKRSGELASTNMENLLSLIEAQRECLLAQQEQLEHKDKAIRHCLEKGKMLNLQRTEIFEEKAEESSRLLNLKQNSSEYVKETDNDTGISEQHSDSSNDTQEGAASSNVPPLTESHSIETHNNSTSNMVPDVHLPRVAATDAVAEVDQNESSENNLSSSAGSLAARGPNQVLEDYLSSEGEANDSGEIFREMRRVTDSLASAEVKFSEQSQLIEVLKSLTAHVEDSARDQRARSEAGRARVQEETEEVRKSLTLSNQLYEYQKHEMQANSMKLQQVESKVSRKRWHVESLLQELENLRLSPSRGKCELALNKRTEVRVEPGTLV